MRETINIRVRSDQFNFDVTLKSRLTFLQGNSSTLKTVLTNVSMRRMYNIYKVESELPIVPIAAEVQINSILESVRDTVIVIDDMVSLNVRELMGYYIHRIKEANVYLLIIDRNDIIFDNVSYSIHDMLKLVPISSTHFVTKEIYADLDDNGTSTYFVAEDSNAGYDLMLRLGCGTVMSSHGKSNVIDACDGIHDVTVLLDTSAFGCHIGAFARFAHELGWHLFYNVQSLEEIFCKICDLYESVDTSELPEYQSLEQFYENKMKLYPKSCQYRVPHGSNLKDCYTKDCKSRNRYTHKGCPYAILDNKLEMLLSKAGFENLLIYRKPLAVRAAKAYMNKFNLSPNELKEEVNRLSKIHNCKGEELAKYLLELCKGGI